MKLILGVLNTFIISALALSVLSCSLTKDISHLSKLKNNGHYLVIGCEIYNLDGEIIKSYPGIFCIFLDDGSVISYDSIHELNKYDRFMKKLWALKGHIHHYISLTASGNILTNSSIVVDHESYKNIRIDTIQLVDQSGKVLNTHVFDQRFCYQKGVVKPSLTKWDSNLKFSGEFTHVSSSYETQFDFLVSENKVVPKGSILVAMNGPLKAAVFLDSNLSKVIHFEHIPYNIHDAQLISKNEMLFFKNNHHVLPKNEMQRSGLVVYDVKNKEEILKFSEKSYSLFGGGVQRITPDLFMLNDSASIHSPRLKFKEDEKKVSQDAILETHLASKSRVVFFNSKKEIIKEINFKFGFNHARVLKLDQFIKHNVGP